MIRAYHITRATLRNGDQIPPIGEWLTVEGDLVICERGLHASREPFDALQYAPGPWLHLVDCSGIEHEHDDKLVCHRRRSIARFDATDILRALARHCALDVIHLWDAPQIVREYLETGDENKRAAAGAAVWAAGDAARAAGAAWDAAGDAARAAAGAAQKTKFREMVDAEFAKIGAQP
jgi:hypothetical protein